MNVARGAFGLILGRRLPLLDGELSVGGIGGPVEIRRDAWGIPHVSASSDEDAWFGIGFCHGQDRAFQLESLLRLVRGTVAEMAGPDGLALDRLSRRIGFFSAAERQLGVLSPEIRATIESYARGIAAGQTLGLRRKPHELVLLRARLTPWTPCDVLAVGKLQACLMVPSWDSELARLRILRADGSAALETLDPSYPALQPVTATPGEAAGEALDRLSDDIARLSIAAGISGASNCWAVAGSRSASGRPLLANDPHLGAVLPSPWYLCHLKTPEWASAGASFVGVPAIAAGHNGFASWGLTAGCVDNADLSLEHVGPDGRSVLEDGAYVECPVRTERIKVRGGATTVEHVLETPRGPIIGPALEGEYDAVALRAVWLDALPVEGLLRLPKSRDFEQFRQCFARWPGPSLNMVYADAGGCIGWQLAGHAPRRRQGHGSLPMPGWVADSGWDAEHLPFDQMPFVEDPAAGFVVSANNRPVPAGRGPFLGEEWADGFRAQRIGEALARRDDWDRASAGALQLDQRSLMWRDIRDTVLTAPRRSTETALALDLLERWDGTVSATSAAATVFELFVAEMTMRIARAKAPRSYEWALSRGFSRLLPRTGLLFRRGGQLARLLTECPPGWFEHSWEEEMATALGAVVQRLQSEFGAGLDRWHWGRVRPLVLVHPVGRRRPLGRIFNLGPIVWGGDTNTVGQSGVDLLDPLAPPTAIAGLRLVIDTSSWQSSRFVLAGGQSGNPCSPNYGDQLPLWQRGDGIPIPWDDAEVGGATRHTLRLLLQGAGQGA